MFKFKQIRQIVEKYDTHEDAGTCLMLTRNQGDACDVTASIPAYPWTVSQNSDILTISSISKQLEFKEQIVTLQMTFF